jgi:hypothetical protein
MTATTERQRRWHRPADGVAAFGSQRERVYNAAHTPWTTRPPGLPGPRTLERQGGPQASADASCDAIRGQEGGSPCTYLTVSHGDTCWDSRSRSAALRWLVVSARCWRKRPAADRSRWTSATRTCIRLLPPRPPSHALRGAWGLPKGRCGGGTPYCSAIFPISGSCARAACRRARSSPPMPQACPMG